MEYVDGLPITKFADEHELGLHDRPELVVKLARAVQHAHESSVLRRDLKPDNVLATEPGRRYATVQAFADDLDRYPGACRALFVGTRLFR
ncbi:MAG: serine/threonine protein kinase [Planctomycetota bacterium]|jgi:serine/threonine protein kinase